MTARTARLMPRSGGGLPRRLASAVTVVALAVTGAVVGSVVPAPPAEAAVSLDVVGRGYGHGRGMSQHGAQARAKAGHTAAQILAFYYPGTAAGTVDDGVTMRVYITGDTDNQTWVRRETNMVIASSNGSTALPNGTVTVRATPTSSPITGTPTLWGLRLDSKTLKLWAQVNGTWGKVDDAAIETLLEGSTVGTFAATDKTVQLVTGTRYREYRGSVTANRVDTALRTTVNSTMASYLQSVVPAEMPAGWHAEALKVQAVAARTYAMHDKTDGGPTWYDTCDSTQCQVFAGMADYDAAGKLLTQREQAATNTAVAATSGQIRTYDGAPAFTQFSSSNGGYSMAGSRPYLVAKADTFDTYSWSMSVPASTIQKAYPSIGTFLTLSVTRDGKGAYGGRVLTATLTGTAGSTTVTGDQLRLALGLRSTLFSASRNVPPVVAPQRDFNGGGADVLARASSGRLYMYVGRPGASFGGPVEIGRGWGHMQMMTQVHDFSATGKPEIVTTHSNGRLYIYTGNGKGYFGPSRWIGRGWAAFDQLIGTEGWQAPGAPGFIVRRAATGELTLYPSDGKGGFGQPRLIGTGWNTMDKIIFAGDWDGDGRSDLIARIRTTGALMLYPGNGAGGFRTPRQIGSGWQGMDEILGGADWDQDGCYDLLARDKVSGRLWIYPGNCAAGFGTPRLIGSGWGTFTLVN